MSSVRPPSPMDVKKLMLNLMFRGVSCTPHEKDASLVPRLHLPWSKLGVEAAPCLQTDTNKQLPRRRLWNIDCDAHSLVERLELCD